MTNYFKNCFGKHGFCHPNTPMFQAQGKANYLSARHYVSAIVVFILSSNVYADLLNRPVTAFEGSESHTNIGATQKQANLQPQTENKPFSDYRKHWPKANALIGRWHVMDPKTGIKMLTCTIHRESKGSYYAVVDRVFPSRFTSSVQYCNKCPAPFLDKPIYNMVILWNMTAQGKGVYGNAVGLDYTQGSLYKAEVKLNKAGNMLTLNAKPYQGNLFTKQQWVKVSD